MQSPIIPESAPFNLEQRSWLNGFLAGLQNVQNLNGNAGFSSQESSIGQGTSTSNVMRQPLLILFGSQSGNTEALANVMADKIKAASFAGIAGGQAWDIRILGMEKFKDIIWEKEKAILLMSSTWGDGDMPDNAIDFWNYMGGTDLPNLTALHFAVLGLGDKNYARYCQAGKEWDKRWADIGAQRLLPLTECDTDYEATADTWILQVTQALEPLYAMGINTDKKTNSTATSIASTSATVSLKGESAKSESAEIKFDKKNPFPAPLLENHPLNAKGSGKDTRHIALSLMGSGLEYKVGDALGVCPNNCYDLTDKIIIALNCMGNEKVTLNSGESLTLRAALLSKLDLQKTSLPLIHGLANCSENSSEKKSLSELLGSQDSEKAAQFLQGKDVLNVLQLFPHTKLDPQLLISALGKLGPRLYSISSSPKENIDEVTLTIGVVRNMVENRLRRGVCSTFLAERLPLGMTAPVFVHKSTTFGLPTENGKPIIMVGPGTGIAPFRAFLQERRITGDTGKNWLFFGDQKRNYDFLYAEECIAWQEEGFLNELDLAFSRDQEEKIYVQSLMLQKSKQLWNWLEEGAYFYVCGDAKRMAKDVDHALQSVISKEGGFSEDKAKEYLSKMKEQKRYQRDVY